MWTAVQLMKDGDGSSKQSWMETNDPLGHRRNNRRDRGRLVPQLLGCQRPSLYWFPNFLAVVFKKQEISQQVVTRMQDLASEFSKIFQGVIPPDPHSGRRRSPPAPDIQPGLCGARGASAPVLGLKPWSPSTFQPWLRPCTRSVRVVKSTF